MANTGQLALTVVATGVGAYFGGAAGAEAGYALGSIAGQIAFPNKARVPQPNDTRVMGASEGTPIPIVVGAYRIAGSVIWAADFKQNSSGGKGTPSSSTASYTYTISFALLLCKGPIIGVRRIWMDKNLVYDRTEGVPDTSIAADDALDQHMAIYLGDEEQLPDPTMQSYLGSTNVTAHRGTAYIVFTDLDVTNYGARIPQVEVEVIQFGETPQNPVTDYQPEQLSPWLPLPDPRNCYNTIHQYQYSGSGWQSSPQAAFANGNPPIYDADTSTCIGWSIQANGVDQVAGYNWTPAESILLYQEALVLHFFQTGAQSGSPCIPDAPADAAGFPGMPYCVPADGAGKGRAVLVLDIAGIINAPAGAAPYVGATAGATFETVEALLAACLQTGSPYTGVTWDLGYQTIIPVNSDHQYSDGRAFANYSVSQYAHSGTGSLAAIQTIINFHISCPFVYHVQCRRVPSPPDNPCSPRCRTAYPLLPAGDYCVINGDLERNVGYAKVSGAYKWLAYTETQGIGGGDITQYPIGPCLPAGDPNDTAYFWEAAYAAALEQNPVLIGGKTYLNPPTNSPFNETNGFPSVQYNNETGYPYYPVNVAYGYERSYTPQVLRSLPIPLATAISDLCLAAGLTSDQFDVTGVSGSLYGYAVARVTNGRDALSTLMTYGFLDAAEISGKLVFIQRGGNAVAALTQDDLIAGSGSAPASSSDSRAAITRAQDVELPRLVRVQFTNVENDYLNGQTPAPRLIDTTIQTQDVQLPIAMTPTQARQIAEILLRSAWIGRETLPISIDASWLETIQSAKPITLSLNGVLRRYRVTSADYAFPSILQLQLTRDEQNAWTSIESAPVTGAMSGSGSQSLSVQGPTQLVPLDIPALRTGDNTAGYYAAVSPHLLPWSGATIFRSVDGGANFTQLVSLSQAGTVGTVARTASAWPETGWDQTNVLDVDLQSGVLTSSTIAGLMNFANVAAYGADGRWELLQFKTATSTGSSSYSLTGLLRGLLGTEWTTGLHQSGDTFVLLTGAIVRIADELSYMGITENLRAVTAGTALSSTADTLQTPREVCLKPLAPVHLSGGRNAALDALIQWGRTDRFANDLVDGSDIPMSETTESYDLEIYTDSTFTTVKRTISTLTSPNTTYSAAEQVADFGAAQSLIYVRVYQNSSQIGRGYPASATI